ncbi:MAG: hypothetical protein WCO25_05625 [Candidatus Uhrbacteria bacterium]
MTDPRHNRRGLVLRGSGSEGEGGFVLLEALLAIGTLAFFLMAANGLAFIAKVGSGRTHQAELATWTAQEGMDALQSLSFSSLTNTTVGSLSFAGGRWTLGTSAPQTVGTNMTRTVKVSSVSRDGSCNVVTSGGTTDADSKKLESVVAWTDVAGRSHTTTLSSLRTQWENPQGTCFKPPAAQSTQVTIDFTTAGQWFGGKQLRMVYVTNSGTSAVVVDKVKLTWTNGREIQQLFFGTTKIWSSSGPGTPSGTQQSGTDLNAQNLTIAAGQTVELNKTQFTGSMGGTTLTLKLTFTDGSSVTTPPFTPTGGNGSDD